MSETPLWEKALEKYGLLKKPTTKVERAQHPIYDNPEVPPHIVDVCRENNHKVLPYAIQISIDRHSHHYHRSPIELMQHYKRKLYADLLMGLKDHVELESFDDPKTGNLVLRGTIKLAVDSSYETLESAY